MQAVIQRCLRKSAADRFQSMAQVKDGRSPQRRFELIRAVIAGRNPACARGSRAVDCGPALR